MKSHVKMVNTIHNRHKGDYAVRVNLLDDTNWNPSTECGDDDLLCQMPTKTVEQCVGDYCSSQLPLSDFSNHNFEKTKFSGSELSCTNFSHAKLSGANFSNSDLCQSNLMYADLHNANLEGADLSFADLRFSDLRGANLSDVRFNNVDIKGARFDRKTQLPISKDEAEQLGMIYCF